MLSATGVLSFVNDVATDIDIGITSDTPRLALERVYFFRAAPGALTLYPP